MITKEQIERINELYKKKTGPGLTEEEEKEQADLRRLYIDSFKQNLKSQLDNIEFTDKTSDSNPQKNISDGNIGKHVHIHGNGCSCGCNHGKGDAHKKKLKH